MTTSQDDDNIERTEEGGNVDASTSTETPSEPTKVGDPTSQENNKESGVIQDENVIYTATDDDDKGESAVSQNITTQPTHVESTMRHGHVYPIDVGMLQPPRTRRERFRDGVLRFLDRPELQVLGIIVMIGVVASGACFFFFLMGWQTLCDTPSKTDCSPRNEIYNISIQILCWLFTYGAVIAMPWRCANFVQVCGCGIRKNDPGLDLYGRPSNEVWFHIDLCNRRGILTCLILNCLLQYANQAVSLWRSSLPSFRTSIFLSSLVSFLRRELFLPPTRSRMYRQVRYEMSCLLTPVIHFSRCSYNLSILFFFLQCRFY